MYGWVIRSYLISQYFFIKKYINTFVSILRQYWRDEYLRNEIDN